MILKSKNNKNICYLNRTVMVMLFSAATLFLSACSEGKEKTAYQLGVEGLKSQNYSEALGYFQASEEFSDLKLSYRGEGMANLGLGNYGEAVSCFENALHESNGLVKSVDYDINMYMAVAQYKMGDYQAAKDTYSAIIAMDKKNSDAYYLRGKIALDMNDVNSAKSDFDSAVAITPQNPELYIRIYDALASHDFSDDAKSYINIALKNISKPSDYQLGIFNFYLGDYTQARNYFEQAKDTKKSPEGIIYLGKTYEALGDAGYAVSLYEIYITGDTESSQVYNELGKLKFSQRDYEGALASFESGLKSSDTSFKQDLMYNRIVSYEYLHDFYTAKTLMAEYLSLYPDDESAQRENIFLSTR